jgi:hypothetical protein
MASSDPLEIANMMMAKTRWKTPRRSEKNSQHHMNFLCRPTVTRFPYYLQRNM